MAHDRIVLRTTAALARRRTVAPPIQRRAAAPASPSPAQALQERLGSHAAAFVARSMAASAVEPSTATRLPVSRPSEPAEIEAEQTARKVVRMPEPVAAELDTVPSIVNDVLHSPGQPLDDATRAFFEPRFGHDFSQVRVHSDARAADSARAVNALAYTVGRDIVFGTAEYAPATPRGQRLLAHELVHVLQTSAGQTSGMAGMDAGPSDPGEQAAERVSERVMSSNFPPVPPLNVPLSHPLLQRYRVPPELPCGKLVGWLNENSPYKPEWAQTGCDYSFNGRAKLSFSKLPDGDIKCDVKGHDKLTVTVKCPIDLPQWNPSKRPSRDAEVEAWQNMLGELDKHEKGHREIGAEWRGKLESRFRALNFSVTGKNQEDTKQKAQEELDRQKDGWGAQAQAAQDKIDPFQGATLTCPPPVKKGSP